MNTHSLNLIDFVLSVKGNIVNIVNLWISPKFISFNNLKDFSLLVDEVRFLTVTPVFFGINQRYNMGAFMVFKRGIPEPHLTVLLDQKV